MYFFVAGLVVGIVIGALVTRRNKNKVDAAVDVAKTKAAEIKSKL